MSLDLTLNNSQFIFKMDKCGREITYEFEKFRVDAAHLMLYRGAEEISLTPKAIETLIALIEKRGEIIGKDELIQTIWKDAIVNESNLAQYLHLLRKTLGVTCEGKPFIETLKRRGYRFNGEVRIIKNSASHFKQDGEKIKIPAFAHDSDGSQPQPNGNNFPLADRKHSENLAGETATEKTTNPSGVFPAVQRKFSFQIRFIAVGFALLLSLFTFYLLKSGSNNEFAANAGSEITFLRLTDGNEVQSATISPDGKYFVYSEQDGDIGHLWLQQTGQSNRLEIVPPEARKIYGKTFSPDSQFVYFVVEEKATEPTSLYRVPTLGGVQTKILTNISAPVSFSPDGKEMVVRRWNKELQESSLVMVTNDGTAERILLKRGGTEEISSGIIWSPDGKRIAFGEITRPPESSESFCTLSTADPQSGVTRQLSAEKWDNCHRMVWTSDGQGLVFIGTKYGEIYSTRRDQIYYFSTASGKSRRISTDDSRYQPLSLGITNDDQLLVVPFNRASQIWAMDASGDARTAMQLTTGLADGRAGIAPLADGRVGFITRTGDRLDVWMMNADGSDRRQLTNDPPIIEEIRAAPDSRYFVFSARRDRRSHLYRIDTNGGNLAQLTDGDSFDVDSTVSPDGKWIAYSFYDSAVSNDKVSLRKISIDGGEPVRLTEYDSDTPHFSPDGKFISFVTSDDRIGIVSAEGGTPVKMFETVESPILNVGAHWTPDGQALTYIVERKNVGNIWQQPINGDPPHPLTDFTSGNIYNYSFSSDSSRLYVARGYQIRDAVLIKNFR